MEKVLENIALIHNRKKYIDKIIGSIKNPIQSKIRVLIFGGGPVGLFTGIKFLEKGKYDVTIIELRKKFTRSPVFMIQNSIAYENLSLLPKELLDTLYQSGCIINAPPFDVYPECYDGIEDSTNPEWLNASEKVKENYPARILSLTISTFQEKLFDYYISKGGKFLRPEHDDKFVITINKVDWSIKLVDSSTEYVFNNNDYDIILGAEGGHSGIRDNLLDDAKNPSNPIEGINALCLLGHKHDLLKNKNKDTDPNIIQLNKEKAYFYKTKFGSDDYKKSFTNYGLVCIIDKNIMLKYYKDRIKNVKLKMDSFIDTDFNQIKNDIDNNKYPSSIPFLMKNKTDFINNVKPSYNSASTDPTVTQPQHRYRFFVSRDKDWYFGISLTSDEFEETINLTSKKYFDIKFSTIKNQSILSDIFVSLFAFYGFKIDAINFPELLDHITFSLFPITLYKTDYYLSHKTFDKRKYCGIIGDAIVGVHYFSGSGVNIGIKYANLLVNAFEKFNWDNHNSNDSSIIGYNDTVYNGLNNYLIQSLIVSMDWDAIKTIIENVDTNNNLNTGIFDAIKCKEPLSTKQHIKKYCDHRNAYADFMKSNATTTNPGAAIEHIKEAIRLVLPGENIIRG